VVRCTRRGCRPPLRPGCCVCVAFGTLFSQRETECSGLARLRRALCTGMSVVCVKRTVNQPGRVCHCVHPAADARDGQRCGWDAGQGEREWTRLGTVVCVRWLRSRLARGVRLLTIQEVNNLHSTDTGWGWCAGVRGEDVSRGVRAGTQVRSHHGAWGVSVTGGVGRGDTRR